MRRQLQHIALIAAGLALALATTAMAAQTKTTEVKKFQVVSVDGNNVVIKDQAGTRELTVPPDFRVTVDGKEVPVSALKPGMNGTATITTTTTITPVTVTEVRSGEVVQASGASIIVKGPDGFKMFSAADIDKRHATIMKDGVKADFSALRAGDRISATIVTDGKPQVLTERQVQATLSGAPPPAPRAATPAPAPKMAATSTAPRNTGGATMTAPASASADSKAQQLPKTGSALPQLAMFGFASLIAGLLLGAARLRRTTR